MGTKIKFYNYSVNQPIFEKMKLALLLICIVVGTMKLSSAIPLAVGSGRMNEERISDEHKGWNGINGKYSGERSQNWMYRCECVVAGTCLSECPPTSQNRKSD